MVKQTPISFKADTADLVKLDAICDQLGCKRNKMLNFLLHYGVSMLGEPAKLQVTSIYSSVVQREFLNLK